MVGKRSHMYLIIFFHVSNIMNLLKQDIVPIRIGLNCDITFMNILLLLLKILPITMSDAHWAYSFWRSHDHPNETYAE